MLPPFSPFSALDAWRRGGGMMSDALGIGPREGPWAEVEAWPGARLRDYGGPDSGTPLLILPAPFKRAYIWDIAPVSSAVQRAIEGGFRVFLLEWLPGGEGEARGLDDFALHLPLAATEAICAMTGREQLVLAGHSFGGTLAAIFACLRPQRVAGLALVDAPLAFGPRDGGPLAAAIAGGPDAGGVAAAFGVAVPGSAINVFCGRAAPEAFVRQPAKDAIAAAAAPDRMALHLRVRRWTLDEFPMPARLFTAIAEDLYRHDRLRAGTLAIGGQTVSLSDLAAPVAAVVNPAGLIVPPRSILAGLRLAHSERLVLRYRPEAGPMLQHLGPLVGLDAQSGLWPRLLDWLAARAAAPRTAQSARPARRPAPGAAGGGRATRKPASPRRPARP